MFHKHFKKGSNLFTATTMKAICISVLLALAGCFSVPDGAYRRKIGTRFCLTYKVITTDLDVQYQTECHRTVVKCREALHNILSTYHTNGMLTMIDYSCNLNEVEE